MIISILASADKVDAVRAKAKEIPELVEHDKILSIPLSETGHNPATHYCCFMNVSEDLFNKIKALEDLTIMDSCPPAVFFKKHKLRVAKERKR